MPSLTCGGQCLFYKLHRDHFLVGPTYLSSEVVHDESHLSDVKNVCESHLLTITWIMMPRLIEG